MYLKIFLFYKCKPLNVDMWTIKEVKKKKQDQVAEIFMVTFFKMFNKILPDLKNIHLLYGVTYIYFG